MTAHHRAPTALTATAPADPAGQVLRFLSAFVRDEPHAAMRLGNALGDFVGSYQLARKRHESAF
jgi:hypothetical protein